ncbi:AAA family ATPase [Bradyrhizobium sp. 76]|nr:AAA family ATPase [Bradyrhizobium sp. 76]
MGIRDLGLRRYGKFTDAEDRLRRAPCGAPDLHIVYGPTRLTIRYSPPKPPERHAHRQE